MKAQALRDSSSSSYMSSKKVRTKISHFLSYVQRSRVLSVFFSKFNDLYFWSLSISFFLSCLFSHFSHIVCNVVPFPSGKNFFLKDKRNLHILSSSYQYILFIIFPHPFIYFSFTFLFYFSLFVLFSLLLLFTVI